MDAHIHACAGITCTELCVRHPAWQACVRLCVEGSGTVLHFSFFFLFFIKPQGSTGKGELRGNVERWEDCYLVNVSVCALLLALTLFTKQIRG